MERLLASECWSIASCTSFECISMCPMNGGEELREVAGWAGFTMRTVR